MLIEVAAELDRRGVQFLIARDIGQIQDMLRLSVGDAALRRVYPTVDDAVRAVSTAPRAPAR
jgi:hypothetical protein